MIWLLASLRPVIKICFVGTAGSAAQKPCSSHSFWSKSSRAIVCAAPIRPRRHSHLPGMSRHRFVKNLNLSEELDDDAFSDEEVAGEYGKTDEVAGLGKPRTDDWRLETWTMSSAPKWNRDWKVYKPCSDPRRLSARHRSRMRCGTSTSTSSSRSRFC